MSNELPPRPNRPDHNPAEPTEGLLQRPREFLPGQVHPGVLPTRRIVRPSIDPEEAAELVVSRKLAAEVDVERQASILEVHGKTEAELLNDADEFLRLHGADDLVGGK